MKKLYASHIIRIKGPMSEAGHHHYRIRSVEERLSMCSLMSAALLLVESNEKLLSKAVTLAKKGVKK